MSGKERAALRAEAHHLQALVHVGHQGLTPTLLQSLDDTLRTKELVKVQLAKTLEDKPKDLAAQLAEAVHAEVIQVIGRTVTLFRENPELPQKNEPAWRR